MDLGKSIFLVKINTKNNFFHLIEISIFITIISYKTNVTVKKQKKTISCISALKELEGAEIRSLRNYTPQPNYNNENIQETTNDNNENIQKTRSAQRSKYRAAEERYNSIDEEEVFFFSKCDKIQK